LIHRAATHTSLLLVALLTFACASSTPTFEDVGQADELYAEGLEILRGRRILWVWPYTDYDGAIETFQAIIDNYPYSEYAVDAELRIADTYFSDKRYEEALSYYRDFGDLHPHHERVPYTVLRSALCHYEQVGSVDRDQSATHEALRYLEELISRYPYSPESRQGENLLRELRTRLAGSMMQTGDFYLVRQEYQAAAVRYRTLLDTYPGLGLDAEGLYKLGVCYENMKREDEALRLFHVILENYRDTDLAAAAAERIAVSN
jgi:outer membrane protein assembly factor BamD